jgi:NADPH-dependent curcumin reductase CurA
MSPTSALKPGETPALQDGQVLVRHHFLSLDPYMRMRMNDSKSYAAPQALGEPMIGGTVGVVAESRHTGFAPGDTVVGMGGWQEAAVVDAGTPGVLRKVDATRIPLSAYLGAVGMPGVTAWVGLNHIIEPKAGETVVVSAASGAVGSVVGQLAKAKGCRVVGLAGGADKCAYVVDELGFDACIDYKQHPDFKQPGRRAGRRRAARRGRQLRKRRRPDPGRGAVAHERLWPRRAVRHDLGLRRPAAGHPQRALLLTQRLKLQGFIVSEHMALWPAALKELGAGVASGQIKFRESVAARHCRRARGLFGPAQGQQLRQATGEAGLNWLWCRFADLGVDNLYDALALRCRVFILEQGPYLDPDGLDRMSWHLLGRDDAGHAAGLPACGGPGREVRRAVHRPRHHQP